MPTGLTREELSQQMRRMLEERVARQQQLDQDFVRENAARYEALQAEAAAITAALEEVAKSIYDPETKAPMTVVTLRRLLGTSDQAFDKIGREDVIYRDYRTAMLEPGLSVEQRRLLFGQALVGLAQALPSPSRLPGERFSTVW